MTNDKKTAPVSVIKEFSAARELVEILQDVQEKWRFAGDELQRMEDDGGALGTEEQDAKMDAYLTAIQQIKVALLNPQSNQEKKP